MLQLGVVVLMIMWLKCWHQMGFLTQMHIASVQSYQIVLLRLRGVNLLLRLEGSCRLCYDLTYDL